MQTKKRKTKSKINWGWDAPEERNGLASRNLNKKVKQIKKVGAKTILIAFCVLIISICIGAGGCYYLTKNDCFELKGNENIYLQTNETYTEEGCNVIAFGKKCTDIEIETDLVVNADGTYSPKKDENNQYIVGTYYIVYKTNNFKYSKLSKIQKIRLVTFVEESEDNV